MKKNTIRVAIVLGILFLVTACKKFITKEIVGDYPETEFYKTQAQAVLAINAAYLPVSLTSIQHPY